MRIGPHHTASFSTACLGHGSLLCLPSQIILTTKDVHDSTTPRRLAQSIGSLRWLCAIEATTIDLSRTLVPAGSLGESRSVLLSMRSPQCALVPRDASVRSTL